MKVIAAVTGICLFVLLLFLERLFPLREWRHPQLYRLFVNLGFSILVFGVASFVIRPLSLSLIGWTSEEGFGLLHLGSPPWMLRAVLGFLLMDLTFYYWHRANHAIALLWRFHNVHHTDPDLDVSTAFRFHFGEVLLSAGFRTIQVLGLGVSAATYAVYEALFQAGTLWHHSNVRPPVGLERVLNRFLVTPRMHGIHHSCMRQETNSNFSVLFPWWDRLHRSLRLNVPQSRIEIGVPAYREPGDNGLRNLLAMPFRRQREYWAGPDATYMEKAPTHPGDRNFLAE